MILRIVLVMGLFGAVPAAAFGQMTGTRTIGTGGDYATPQDAVTALNAQGVGAGGVIFNVLGGTYDLSTTPVRMAVMGAADRPIEFRSAGLGEPILTRTLATGHINNLPLWGFQGESSYITLRGLTFRTVNCNVTTNRHPLMKVSQLRILGCRIETVGWHGIDIGSDTALPANMVSDVTITDNTIEANSSGRWAMVIYGERTLVARNFVRASRGINIQCANSLVEDNQVLGRIWGIAAIKGGEIRRNRIQLVAAVGGIGILDYGTETKIHHNTITFDPDRIEGGPDPVSGVSGGHAGIVLQFSQRSQCVFNSIYIRVVGVAGRAKSSAGILVSGEWETAINTRDVVIANNVVQGSASYTAAGEGTAEVHLIYWDAVTNVDLLAAGSAAFVERLRFTSTTNCLNRIEEGTGTVLTFRAVRKSSPGGSTVVQEIESRTLAEWQAFSGKDAGSVDANPLFVSTTDLHLQPASPVQGLGTPFTAYIRDIDGDRRKATPDMGADEPRPARLAGDASGNGVVDASDYVIWRNNLGRRWVGLTFAEGDFNLDGRVDSGDYIMWRKLGLGADLYQVWRANYGRTSPPKLAESDGNLNDDDVVDMADYNVWRANYGRRIQ